jgi:CDP-diacylglycerol--glycerol-3-phosphate 3-phosphatidyltransferase
VGLQQELAHNGEKKHNLPLYLTSIRIILSPIFVGFFLVDSAWAPTLCLVIVLFMELSDLADGFAARRRQQVTTFGKLLDPYADSIYRLTAYICFLSRGIVPLIPVVVLFYRDSTISLTRILCGRSGITLGARMTGKIKAWFQALGIVIILVLAAFRRNWEGYSVHTEYAVIAYLVMMAALVSGVDYIIASREMYRREFTAE